jgi:hypothetical protein
MTTIVIDEFFKNFAAVRKLADEAHYQDEVYPADNTVYPGICKDLPRGLVASVVAKTGAALGKPVAPVLTFLRLSVPSGTRAPHYVHTDLSTGQGTLLVYLSDAQDGAGTGFYRHKETGMIAHPDTPEGVAIWARDQRDMSLWEQTNFVPMKRNRAVIFSAEQFHCALPTGGFGNGPVDGRLALTMFFNAAG